MDSAAPTLNQHTTHVRDYTAFASARRKRADPTAERTARGFLAGHGLDARGVQHVDGRGIKAPEILGDHLAEARVLEDDMGNPMIPGDKLYTPLWSPGAKRHFALAGTMDIDNDGRSDLQTVLNLIAINGGVVDCYVNDAGKQIGEITVNTNCLILGKKPDEKSEKKVLDAFSKLDGDAKQLRLPTVQLGDFLQRTGWKKLSPVVRFGRGANPNDFCAKPPAGVPKKSSGNISDLFQKRQPSKAPASDY